MSIINETIVNDDTKLDEFLELDTIQGLNRQCKNSICFLSDSSIIYLVGSILVKFDIETFKQKTIVFKSSGKFQCMELSSNKRYALLVDIDQASSNLILINLKLDTKNNIHNRIKIQNNTIKCISISSNMELIICLDLNWNIIIYSFLKLKKLAETQSISNLYSNEQTVEEISFLPNENKKFVLVGHRLVKIFQYITINRIKLVCNIECSTLMESHVWFGKNDLITFDKFLSFYIIDPKQNSIKPLNFINKNDSSSSYSIVSSSFNQIDPLVNDEKSSQMHLNSIKKKLKLLPTILSFNDGFFVSNLTESIQYYKIDSLNNFIINFTIKLPRLKIKEFIIKIHLNDSKTIIIAVTNRNLIYYYHLKNCINRRSFELDLLNENFHFDSITSIDTCIRKSLIVTCSIDRWLNIWNYETKQIELRQQFDQDLTSVAFHPSGLFIILSSTHTIRYLKICLDSFQVLTSIAVRNCSNCIFSNGGHMFAFVQGTIVQIYSSIKYNELGAIKAQEMGKVKQLKFTQNDHYLICCSMAGIIKIWNIHTLLPNYELITKGLSYIGLALHPDQEMLFLISTEKAVRQFQLPISDEQKSQFKANTQAKLVRKFETNPDENLTCIEISKSGKILCVGTNKGCLRVFLLSNGSHKDYRAHSGSLNKMRITCNDEYLITTSDDGTIVFWQIKHTLRKETNNEFLINNNKSQYALLLEQDIVLTNRKEFLTKSQQIIEIQQKIDELNIETDFKLRIKDLKFRIKTKDLGNQFNNQINLVKKQLNEIKTEQHQGSNNFNLELEFQVTQHLKDILSLHYCLNDKLNSEREKNSDLELKIKDLESQISNKSFKVNQIKQDTLGKQYERVEIYLKITDNNHLKQLNKYENEIDKLKNFEILLDEELESELAQINVNHRLQVSNFMQEKNYLNNQFLKLQNEFKLKESQLNEIVKENDQKNKDYFQYLNKLKDLEQLDFSLKQEYQLQLEKSSDDKEIIELEASIANLELLNKSYDQFIDSELKHKLEPLKYNNKMIKSNLNEIKNEMKLNKMQILKMKNEIESMTKIYKVKFDELIYLNEKTKEKYLSSKKIIINIKKIAKDAARKGNLNVR